MKEPKVTRLKSGSYRTRLRIGGQDISITRLTKEECRDAALELKTAHKLGKRGLTPKEVQNLTLKEVMEKYIQANRAVLSPSTVRSYSIYARTRFTSYQNCRLKDIPWQQAINDELEECSPKTLRNSWALIRPALELVGYPVPKVKLPQCPVQDLAFLSPDEIKLFCQAIRGKPYEIPCLLMLHGLRLSEVLGLDWSNIDLKNNLITVSGAMVRGPEGMTSKRTNKNQSSTRKLPIMIPRLSEALEAATRDSGPVVSNHPSVLLDDVKRACKAAGVTEVSCHGLRRSFASLGYYLKIPERQLMSWGGWSDYTTMHKVYIKLSAAAENEEAKKVSDFFKTSTK